MEVKRRRLRWKCADALEASVLNVDAADALRATDLRLEHEGVSCTRVCEEQYEFASGSSASDVASNAEDGMELGTSDVDDEGCGIELGDEEEVETPVRGAVSRL